MVMDLSPGANALFPRKDFPQKAPRAFNEGNQSAVLSSAAQVSKAAILHRLILTSQKREWAYKSPQLHIGTYTSSFIWGAEHPSTQGKQL